MKFSEMAKKRKTTYEYTNKKIKQGDINKILEAARWAPSCSNIQPWRFVVVLDKKRIESLMNLATYGVFHTNPPAVIAVLLDKDQWSNSEHRCIQNDCLGVYEAHLCAAMPALNICYQALDLGIDSCMLTPRPDEIHELLNLRNGDSVPLIIGLGYEKKGAFQKKRERRNLGEMLSYEYYGGKLK